MKSSFYKQYPVSLVFFIFLFLYALIYLFWGETIPVNNGLGWDGVIYGQMAEDFYHFIFVKHVGYYYAQRILPSGVIHAFLRMFHYPLRDAYVIKGFQVLNAALILVSTVLWQRICSLLKLPISLQWVAFIGLYINFAILKQAFYYPVLTDASAFFLGVAMLYFYLMDNPWGVLGVSLAGAFTWPSSVLYGFFLFVLPRSAQGVDRKGPLKPAPILITALSVAVFFLMFTVVPYIKNTFHIFPDYQTAPVERSLIGASILAGAVYLFYGTKQLMKNFGWPASTVFKKFGFKRPFVFLLLLIVTHEIVHSIGTYGPLDPTVAWYFKSLFYFSCVKPLIFLVANVVYYGPVILCAVFLWGAVIKKTSDYGAGLGIMFFFIFFLSLDTEVRHQMFAFPFVVAFTVKAMEGCQWPRSFCMAMLALSLVFSKIFFFLNQYPFKGRYLDFPFQYYYMNHGPWMSKIAYLYQGGAVIVAAAVLHHFLQNKYIKPQ